MFQKQGMFWLKKENIKVRAVSEHKCTLSLLLGLEVLLAPNFLALKACWWLETPAGLPSLWSHLEGGSHPPTQLEERRFDFQSGMVSCAWYGALWWPFFWAVGLATQTSMIQPASGWACPLGKRTLKGQKEATTTDREGKTSWLEEENAYYPAGSKEIDNLGNKLHIWDRALKTQAKQQMHTKTRCWQIKTCRSNLSLPATFVEPQS